MTSNIYIYEIYTKRVIKEVVEILFKNRDKLSLFNNNDKINIAIDDMYYPDKINKPYYCPLQISFGKYYFKVSDDNILEIEYSHNNTPIKDISGVDYYKKIIIKSDNHDKFNEFFKTYMIVKPEIDENKLNIFIVNKYGEWRIYNRIPKRLLNSIYIEEELKIKLLGDIRNFLEREDEYDRFGIPYKKSCLLTGIPGSGKTSIIKAICNEIGYSLSMLSLQKEFDNNSLLHAFGNLEKNSILLLEDIDCIFEHRKASSDTPFLSFSNLLNILDGVLYKHGIIIFITTNHPEKLDHALLRMGRIDMIIQLNYPRETEIKKLFMDINDKLATEDELLLLYNKFYSSIKNKNITMAAIVNFLFKYRIKCIDNIKELIDTNQYLKVLSGDDKKENLYN